MGKSLLDKLCFEQCTMDTWSDLCRCCLSSSSKISLFDINQDVKLKFQEITSIEINHDDGLPQKLCDACFNNMNNAYQFRKQCIKMDTDLKQQLNSIVSLVKGGSSHDIPNNDTENNIANEPMKQFETSIKSEPVDSDDDCYYVLVIDDPKDKENTSSLEQNNDNLAQIDLPNIKLENIEPLELPAAIPETSHHNEPFQEQHQSVSQQQFENTIDSFLVSNTKVPINVPATILENEEESQESDDHFNNIMNVNTQDDSSQEGMLPEIGEINNGDSVGEFPDNIINTKNLLKILSTSGSDGTIVLKSSDGVEYLTSSQLVTSDGDMADQQVILCEGDESSQFQILKCEGNELVIEYADEDEVATVLQQEDGTFLCECGDEFVEFSDYQIHQTSHMNYTQLHSSHEEHLCNLCGKVFESDEILTGHTLLHSVPGSSVNCPFCSQVVRRNALTQHIKYFHANKPTCSVCLKTFANPNNLKRHMMIHNGIREFECDVCFKRFHQKITMQTHKLTHQNPYSCKHCDASFTSKTELCDHLAESCMKNKVSEVKNELMKTVKQEVINTLGKLLGYACSLCKKMFSLESVLEQHIEAVHLSNQMELLCSECGIVLPSKKELQSHLGSHKLGKTKYGKRFECTVCGKSCSSQAMLIMHERVHTNERPFPCQLCSLRFKTKTHLRTHQLTHTREKKFGCSVCMKFFALKGNLVVHLRTHTGERPYQCTLCGEAFIDSKYLKKHKVKKHSIHNVPWNKY